MGRLTADPELKTTSSGISFVSFTVAVDRRYQTAGQEKQADFINCVAWRQQAEFISKYFRKGQMIAVEGSIQTRTYDGRDGTRRYAVEIVADNISFCGGKSETGASGGYSDRSQRNDNAGQEAASFRNGDADDFSEIDSALDDLPF